MKAFLVGSSSKLVLYPNQFPTEQTPYAVGLAERTVNRAIFGHAHFGAAYERRNVRRVSITVAHKAAVVPRLINVALKAHRERAGSENCGTGSTWIPEQRLRRAKRINPE